MTEAKRVLLAAPRGWCAGVDRAVRTVERALDQSDETVYVRHEIVHNRHVVSDLHQRGALFVESTDEVPEGATVVLSAHGVAPSVKREAAVRGLHVIDATCPLVEKVHREARRFAAAGYRILLIGHAGHEEVTGTLGYAPGRIHLVESPEHAATIEIPGSRSRKLVWLSQTTLSVDEVMRTVAVLRRRFRRLEDPPSDDICYATQNRQHAVRELVAHGAQLVLVVGSANSSNSQRMVDVAEEAGARAALIDDASQADPGWLQGLDIVGVSSGASAPEHLVTGLLEWLAGHGYTTVEEVVTGTEGQRFALPRNV
ncbi:4-hydroxy-3-methylbut-2-enyl diphosphate reductase [Kitasatospora sp. LaBMicrA B282]|uniref:4-hydroxy-3-methylbut-2-enyl diphosphate reductase n=1 Tax=Kitasatospora sp. LaBMicrA B282 TaxID=3420949 RepID=UPI003D1421C1